MNTRIKKVRTDYGLTQKEFAESLGISAAAVCRLETGQNNPSEQTVKAICREYGIDEHWLRTGEGSEEPELTRKTELARWIGRALKDEPESWRLRLLNALLTLDKEDYEAVVRLAEKVVETKQKTGE